MGDHGDAGAVHPLVRQAAAGDLPVWTEAGASRRAHMARVAGLMGGWADAQGLTSTEGMRWRAAGFLHDALRDADPAALRDIVPEEAKGLPARLLHGPAAAARLAAEGVDDDALLLAVAWHTIGHPRLDRMGRALFIADFVEPGRTQRAELLAGLRARMPHDLPGVLFEVTAARIMRSIEARYPLRDETRDLWNRLVEEHGAGEADSVPGQGGGHGSQAR